MDKYTKMILTVIAIGIIGLNIQLIERPSIFTKAHANNHCGNSANPCEIKETSCSNNRYGIYLIARDHRGSEYKVCYN